MVQQELRPPGGASAVAAWMLETLKDDYQLTALTFAPPDFAALDQFYGTQLDGSGIGIIRPNPLMRAALQLDRTEGSIQSAAFLMRMCRRLRHDYDLVIAAGMEEMDLGGPGLMYVHYPHLARFWGRYHDRNAGWRALLRGETRPWMFLAGYSIGRMKQCRFLTNSDWTGHQIDGAYGIQARTIYPPVTASPKPLSWELRDDSFVCVGRLQERKRMDWVISTLRKVRLRHRSVRLHLVGTRDEGRAAGVYYRALLETVNANREWVQLHEDLSRDDLLQLMGRSRYAIHALIDEHFGIAPAEALMAGCIPFVHDSGGQVEIVGGDPRLCYRDDEAEEKISTLLASEDVQRAVLRLVADRQELFTVQRFMASIREEVSMATGGRRAEPR